VATTLRTVAGGPVARVGVGLPGDVPPLRTRLGQQGVPTFEADVRFAIRYLIDRGLRGAFEVDGVAQPRRSGRLYHNPTLRPSAWTPSLRVLSLDIETSPDARALYSIAVAGAGGDRVFLLGRRAVAGADVFPDERSLVA